ncbi:MAG: phage/plasmid primase, P4 family [Nitrososphaera sp.]
MTSSLAGTYGPDSKGPPAEIESKDSLIATIAEELMQKYSFVTIRDNLELRYYKNGIYMEGAESEIHEYIVKRLGYRLKNRDRVEVIEHIRYRNVVDRSEFDTEIDLLNVKNGLLDINTGKLREHDPAYLSMSQIPARFNPKARCVRIGRFLNDVLEREKVPTAVMMFGYMLHRGVEYEKAFLLIGSGSNGKTTLINVIKAFFGLANCSSESLHSLVSDRFAAAELHNKYVNVFADLKSDRLPETGPFKMLTSGDIMSAQKKYGERFQFSNFAKMVFAANNPPDTQDGYAYYRRLVVLPFDRTFDVKTNLLAELTSEEELSGLLNLALAGWKLLRKVGKFPEESVEKIRQEYQYRANHVKRFVDDECIIDLNDRDCISTTDRIYTAYAEYCEKHRLRKLPLNTFGSSLHEFGIINERRMKNKQRDTYYVGIKLKADARESNGVLL